MKNLIDLILGRNGHVCPWWCCFTFDNPIRKRFQDPSRIISEYINPGDTVIDIGPGQGYFTIPMARRVGEKGRVFAIDIQSKMLAVLARTAAVNGMAGRIVPKQVTVNSLELDMAVDFALAFWMVHEVPDQHRFLKEIYQALKPGKLFLLAEPKIHVSAAKFAATVSIAEQAGFKISGRPAIWFSRAVLLSR